MYNRSSAVNYYLEISNLQNYLFRCIASLILFNVYPLILLFERFKDFILARLINLKIIS